MLQQDQGCANTYVLDDQDVYGDELARSFAAAAMARKLSVAGIDGYQPGATDYSSLVASVAASRAGCVFISAVTEHSAVLLSTEIAAAMPRAKIFVPDGVAESSYTDPLQGGIPLVDDPRVSITAATLSPSYYPPTGRAFLLAYAARFGTPEPYAIYGYEAMSLLLNAIRRATDDGRGVAERSRVVAAIFGTRNRHSVLGTYSIDRNGDTTMRTYGAYRVVRGQLAFSTEMRG
jgi:branched-chain amino acid transport system substrate-binding protein